MKKKTYTILTMIPLVKLLLSCFGIEEFKPCSPMQSDYNMSEIHRFARDNPDLLITPKIALKILKRK